MNGKLLITGGTGSLGSRVARFLNSEYEVTLQTHSGRKLPFGNFDYLKLDLTDQNAVTHALLNRSFDFILHLASFNEHTVQGYAQKALQVNTMGTLNLLEAVRTMPLKHFIYMSTFHVYGRSSGSINEDTPASPKHDYALTHLFAEQYIQLSHRLHGLPFTIFRLTNSYGCPLYLNSSKWYLILNDLARTAKTEGVIKLKSNGKALRDYIWMDDVARVINHFLKNEVKCEIFNLSSGSTFSTLEIANAVREAYQEQFGETLPVIIDETDNSESNHLSVDNSRLRKVYPMEFQVKFKEEASNIFRLLEKC